MQIKYLDHVNILTNNLDRLVNWYSSVLGLKNGYRPSFSVRGAWLYLNDIAVIHALEAPHTRIEGRGGINHFAFSANGLASMLNRLKQQNVYFIPSLIHEANIIQINIEDPDGNAIHVDFSAEEIADAKEQGLL